MIKEKVRDAAFLAPSNEACYGHCMGSEMERRASDKAHRQRSVILLYIKCTAKASVPHTADIACACDRLIPSALLLPRTASICIHIGRRGHLERLNLSHSRMTMADPFMPIRQCEESASARIVK